MKRVLVALALTLAMAAPAFAVDFEFHGDFNHRFRMYTNHASFFNGIDKAEKLNKTAIISDDTQNDTNAEFKYRLWTTASSDDGAIKGVFAVEIGAVEFGRSGSLGKSTGGGFSGDSVNIETRWAYVDFALAGGRTRMGLMPIKVNKFLWNETVTGIDYKIAAGAGDLTVAWFRGYDLVDTDNSPEDLDAFYLRYDLKPADGTKVGFFGLWQTSDGDTVTDTAATPSVYYTKAFTGFDLDLYTLGVDGSMKAGALFANWDLMYQFGDLMEEYDFGGYFIHADVGAKMGKGKLKFTVWYASGDDDSTDSDYDAFVATDIDINSEYSVVLFEGYNDDDYFSSSPYIQDKGLILTRVGYDFQATDKLKIGVAALYLMTAEDIEYTDDNGIARSDDEIGFEFDAYASYQLFSTTEAAIQFGYLAAGDAMDYYEVDCDGNSDEDIFIISSRIRYKF
ncbi:MAG: hypothetical protein U9R29_09010 [Thermodesulfobacteriota bacterium]|nr:hypothetical protein [Thermodesulfobacteriota bacterium]